jgi:hypothetical protein
MRSNKQAILTRYIGPTNSRKSRIKAFSRAGSVTLNYDHDISQDANHERAAKALCDKFTWAHALTGGQLPNGDYAWIQQ